MAIKQRGINFYTLVNKFYRSDEEEICSEIGELLNEIKALSILEKIVDISNDKFVYLESADINTTNTITAIFVSAKNQYRADLLNRRTGASRPNPKSTEEGEKQKTHIVIKIETDRVKVVLEKNGSGVSMNQIRYYFNQMNRKIYEGINYTIAYDHVPQNDFLQKIEDLPRIMLAEMYITKEMLGNDGLGYSQRIANIKQNLVVTVQSKRGASIKEAVIDLFNIINTGRRTPSRLTIKGKDDDRNDVVLDTFDFIMKDSAWFEINNDGEIQSPAAFTKLKGYLRTF